MNTPTVSTTTTTINDELRARLASVLNLVDDGMSAETLRLNANLSITLRGEDGEIKDTREVHNIITTAGKTKLMLNSGASTVASFAYVAIGSGTTAVAAGDTAMQTEIVRALGTLANPAGNQLTVTYTFPAGTGTNGAITEYGLLDSASVGTLLAHQTAGAIAKGASDTLQVQWTLSL